ncbi:uncharacterized [Tachysurus ichikawai]
MTTSLALMVFIILQEGRLFEQYNKVVDRLLRHGDGWFVLLGCRGWSLETTAWLGVKLWCSFDPNYPKGT